MINITINHTTYRAMTPNDLLAIIWALSNQSCEIADKVLKQFRIN